MIRTLFLMIPIAIVITNALAAPVFEKNVERPLRYHPEGTDFVIENGAEFFNRPLYGPHTPFRADAGDKPEFALYLPGRGGNLRLGIRVGEKAKWLHTADKIVARYRPGSMVYEIRDALLGAGVLRVTALGMADAEGLMIRAEIEGAENATLIAAFGGMNGDKGSRNVDIGCEPVPVSQWWQLKPEYCAGNQFTIDGSTFSLRAKAGTVGGFFSPGTKIALGNAVDWDKPEMLTAGAAESATPVAVAVATLTRQAPVYIVLKPLPDDAALSGRVGVPPAGSGVSPERTSRAGESSSDPAQTKSSFQQDAETGGQDAHPTRDFAAMFDAAEKHRREIAETIVVDTPDPFINAAASALCVAANALWEDKEGTWMHGVVAWRTLLLGWRGDYIGDTLGWHDRQQRFFNRWTARQNTKPIPEKIPTPEESANFARHENALHSNGDMSNSHYDMNLVFIDALFRHLLWTGDLDYARKMWPVIERHLAWEQRMFRREFGPEKLPLYEAYCCIWASDDLWYSGGGATHSSAYNFYHNKMAARVAKLIGKDAAPYEREADLIAQGMRKNLWLADRGWFAESKDLLGLQRTHDNPALWTFYHTIDSEVPTAAEATQMMRYIDTNIAHIPIKGPGVPNDCEYFTLPTTNWMPYTWSTNNVVMAESAHTALAYWQTGRSETAFELFKGCILDSMFMGLSPGNVGMCTQFDMARGESQRDFADGAGMTARALVEGLFGIKVDALAGELIVHPGFPEAWDHASLKHPDVELNFKRSGLTETFSIKPKFAKPMALWLETPARHDDIARVTLNGQPSKWSWNGDLIVIAAHPASTFEVAITWKGEKRPQQPQPAVPTVAKTEVQAPDWNKPLSSNTECVNLEGVFNDKVSQIFKNEYLTPRSPFCSLAIPKQGYGSWCHPDWTFEVDDSGLRAAAAKNGDRIALPNGLPLQTPGTADARNIAFVSQWDNYPRELAVPLNGKAAHVYLLMAGSTNSMQSRIDNGEVIVTYTDGSTVRLALHNPTTWWPIDQDYVIDDYGFRYAGPIPPRVDLKTGKVRLPKREELIRGPIAKVPGGAATVLDLPLDPAKELKSLTIRALASEVVIGLMGVTLAR